MLKYEALVDYMERKIVVINEEKCTGCGLCARACHEGAIKMIEGKAHLISESYCDGLGDCLPHCPSDAITIETKNVASYDHEAVFNNMEERIMPEGELINWPIQLKLAPVRSPLYNNGHLLIAASCTAFSYKNFYKDLCIKEHYLSVALSLIIMIIQESLRIFLKIIILSQLLLLEWMFLVVED